MTNLRLSRVIAFRPEFVAITGSIPGALYLSQVVWYTQQQEAVRMTDAKIASETMLGLSQVKSAYKVCLDKGFIASGRCEGFDRAKIISADLEAIESALRAAFPSVENRPIERTKSTHSHRSETDQSSGPVSTVVKGSISKKDNIEEIVQGLFDSLHDSVKVQYTAWLEFRKEKRKPVSNHAKRLQIKMLLGMFPTDAVASIETSMRNDWAWLFPVKGQPRTQTRVSKFEAGNVVTDLSQPYEGEA